jgi:uncharacterized protein YciI
MPFWPELQRIGPYWEMGQRLSSPQSHENVTARGRVTVNRHVWLRQGIREQRKVLFTILCTFRPGGHADAKNLRLEHYAFVRKVKGTIVEGGPLLGPDGVPTNTLIVVDRENEDAVKRFIADEPYTENGLFESVSIRRWSHVIPEPSENFIESEYKKEMSLRGE